MSILRRIIINLDARFVNGLTCRLWGGADYVPAACDCRESVELEGYFLIYTIYDLCPGVCEFIIYAMMHFSKEIK